MSRTVSRGREAGAAAGGGGARGGGRWGARGVVVVVVVVAGAVAGWEAGVFSPAASPRAGQQSAPAPATAAVARENITATTPVNATLGYAGSFPVTGRGGGTLTWLPPAGQVISQGQGVYKTGHGGPGGRRQRGGLRGGLGLLLCGDGGRGAEAAVGAGDLLSTGVAVAGAGG